MSLYLALILGLFSSPSYTYENVRMMPRLTQLNAGSWSFSLPSEQPNAIFYMDTPDSLYVGGQNVLYHFANNTRKTYTINEKYNCQKKTYCENFVTFVTKFNGYIMVCGTNANNPACWKMDGEQFEKHNTPWAEQLSPRIPGSNYNILYTGIEMYSTIPRQSNNAVRKAIFQKIYGNDPMRFTGDNLLKNPVFVKSLVVEGAQATESRIFLFFMDDNSESRTTDKRVAMIARMCKEEKGSEQPDDRNMFSTALKSRLICGNSEGQYYNVLQDVYFLQSQNLVYALFTNAWNHSAVCTYNIEDIEWVFNSSDLFESSKKDLKIRPGKCLSDHTPQETAVEAARHPELVDWVWPSGNQTVFQTLHYYRKLVVDEILAINNVNYRVIIVATDNGTLHKIVELHDGALNVLEMHPFNKTGKILYLELDPSKKERHALYVGTAHQISRLHLDDCRPYNKSCTDCISSRDPYCGWYNSECQSIVNSRREQVLQNLTQGAMCDQPHTIQALIANSHRSSTMGNNGISPPVYYLTCPADSKQATYWWTYGNNKERCTPHNGKCNLYFDDIKDPGEYRCIQEEFSSQRLVTSYRFALQNSSSKMQYGWLLVLVIVNVCHNVCPFASACK